MKEKRDYKIAKTKTVQPSPVPPPLIHQTEIDDSVNTVGVQELFIVNGRTRYPIRHLQAILRLSMAKEENALNARRVKK